jgi:hypothetical protein
VELAKIMSIFRRILKYTPAVLLILLVAAWWVGLRKPFGPSIGLNGQTEAAVFSYLGSCVFACQFDWPRSAYFEATMFCIGNRSSWTGAFGADAAWSKSGQCSLIAQLPIGVALTAVTPLVMGPFVSFRFRLWHYLAYAALVAVELAYYLRWQE